MKASKTRASLIQRLSDGGDEKSWEDFSGIYSSYIYAVIHRMGVGHEDCKDLTQSVLVKVWKGLGAYSYDREKCKFRTWLGTVCRNTAINFSKSKQGRENQRKISGEPQLIIDLQKNQPEIDMIIENEWKLFISQKAWDKVQNQFNEVTLSVYKFCIEGEKVKDVAEKLGLAENTIFIYRKRVQQAIKREILRMDCELG